MRESEAQGTLRVWGLKGESLEGPGSRGVSRTEVSRRLWGHGVLVSTRVFGVRTFEKYQVHRGSDYEQF